MPKVVHVVPDLSNEQGGPAYTVPALCDALALLEDFDVELCSISNSSSVEVKSSGVRDRRFCEAGKYLPMVEKLRVSFALETYLRDYTAEFDLVHAHGLWQLPTVAASRNAHKRHKPLIVSPRGMLSPVALSYSSLRKKIFWLFAHSRSMIDAACFHATSQAEAEDIRAFGIRSPIVVIPNGIDVPLVRRSEQTTSEKTVLALGRIHPKKGLLGLIEAWAQVEKAREDWRLRIVGNDEGHHAQQLVDLANSLGLKNVSVEGPQFGEDKWRLLQEAKLFVLATKNENFGVVVAEALACGVPVICTTGAPWSGLKDNRCGWWIDESVSSIAGTLLEATAVSLNERHEMGERGRSWMQTEFGWAGIALRMADVYRELMTMSANAGRR